MMMLKKDIYFFSFSVSILGTFLAFHPYILNDYLENIFFFFLMGFSVFLAIMDRRNKVKENRLTIRVEKNKKTNRFDYWIKDKVVNREEMVFFVKVHMEVDDLQSEKFIQELERKASRF